MSCQKIPLDHPVVLYCRVRDSAGFISRHIRISPALLSFPFPSLSLSLSLLDLAGIGQVMFKTRAKLISGGGITRQSSTKPLPQIPIDENVHAITLRSRNLYLKFPLTGMCYHALAIDCPIG